VRESFILYTKYDRQLEKLSNEQRGILFAAIMKHQKGEELPEMDLVTDIVYSMIEEQLDADTAKYEETCQRRSEAGKKGADSTNRQRSAKTANAEFAENGKRQKSAKTANAEFAEIESRQKSANSADNDSDSEYDNESDSDNESDTVSVLQPLKGEKRVEKQKEKPSKKKSTVYDPDEKLNQAILDFIDFRRSAKKPMTDNAIDLMLRKLRGMASDNDERIAILEQSVLNGWTGLYPLKAEKARGEPEDRFKVISDWLSGMEGNDDISGIC
jgi:hypothetical protein